MCPIRRGAFVFFPARRKRAAARGRVRASRPPPPRPRRVRARVLETFVSRRARRSRRTPRRGRRAPGLSSRCPSRNPSPCARGGRASGALRAGDGKETKARAEVERKSRVSAWFDRRERPFSPTEIRFTRVAFERPSPSVTATRKTHRRRSTASAGTFRVVRFMMRDDASVRVRRARGSESSRNAYRHARGACGLVSAQTRVKLDERVARCVATPTRASRFETPRRDAAGARTTGC